MPCASLAIKGLINLNPLKFGLRLGSKYFLLAWFVQLSVGLSGCGIGKTTPSVARQVRFDKSDCRLIWPLPIITTARITSYYGDRKDPLDGMRTFHTGVDFDGEIGTPIHAAGAGKVIFSGRRSGYGFLLIIDHSKGLTTYYGHCSRLLLQRGDRVNRGQVIALMGASGRTTGSHLHFETRKHGRHFDPFLLMPKLRKL